jgi:hypothetical protein
MILSYCEHCGTFVRAEDSVIKSRAKILCVDCAAGIRPPRRCKDSDRIPNPFRAAFRAAKLSKESTH